MSCNYALGQYSLKVQRFVQNDWHLLHIQKVDSALRKNAIDQNVYIFYFIRCKCKNISWHKLSELMLIFTYVKVAWQDIYAQKIAHHLVILSVNCSVKFLNNQFLESYQ